MEYHFSNYLNNKLRTGELLINSGLVSEAQVQVALRDQAILGRLHRIGEILALRGWVRQETIDFLIIDLPNIIQQASKLRLGEYLIQARLLTQEQVDELLKEQRQCGVRIGSLAVMHGWISKQTLDFFLELLFPEKLNESDLEIRVKVVSNQAKDSLKKSSMPSAKSEIYEDPWVFDRRSRHE